MEYGEKRFAGNAIVNYNAMVNVPLNDLFALRATYSQSLDPGIYENIITQNKDVGDQDDERYTALKEMTLRFMTEILKAWLDILLAIVMTKV